MCGVFVPPTGVRTIAPNGFMNGTTEEEEQQQHGGGVGGTEDVYPADGPLQSGTQSLRRIKQKPKVYKFNMPGSGGSRLLHGAKE